MQMLSAASDIPVLDINTFFWPEMKNYKQKDVEISDQGLSFVLTPCIAMSKLQHLSFFFHKTGNDKLCNPLRVPSSLEAIPWPCSSDCARDLAHVRGFFGSWAIFFEASAVPQTSCGN